MLDGLKTFPFATELTDGEKMIEAEFGIKGYAVLIKLYQAIYSRGYYMKWDIDTKLLFIRDYYLTEVGGNLVSEIVAACIRRGVFDSALYEQYQILTSSRIEETFLTAKQRSVKVIMDKNYALPIVYTFIENANKKGKNVNIFFKNADSLPTFSDKGKERKGNTPYIPLKGGGERDFKGEFFKAYPKLKPVRTDDSFVDYSALLKAFENSECLRTRYSMRWVLENYDAVIRGDFADAESAEGARAARESWYAERRAAAEKKAHKALQQALKDKAYAAADGWVRQLAPRIAFEKDEKLAAAMQAQLDDAECAKAERLKELGLDIQVHYHCTKCSDTGFLPNGRPCDCYNKED